jgi:methionyl aminopeptidase
VTLPLEERKRLLAEQGAVPSFKGYRGYPSSTCISINEVVVHGIPGERVIEAGDIVGIDLGAIVDGWHGDSAVTLPVGEVSDEARRLMRVTREALFRGIAEAKVGNRLSDISHAIQQFAERHGYSVVRDLVGHGIGSQMHEDPQVPNFGKPGRGIALEEGMTLAIEPMVNAGMYEVESLRDGWTVVTRDRKLSAHFEHTVAIRAAGPEILTLRRDEEARH